MTISEFFSEYNLHDCLIESINYDEVRKTITLEIDFCYWQQESYTDDTPETGMITLVFSDVKEFDYTPFEIDSDEIISVQNNSENELYFEVCNDMTEECHSIRIEAQQVEILMDSESD